MASRDSDDTSLNRDSEPLLGRPGDVLQNPDDPVVKNLYKGTGGFAIAGSLLLVALVWSAIFSNKLLPLFSPHPLLQSLGVLTTTQAILILQPTWTPGEKLVGARLHATLHLLSFLLLASGVVLIEANKVSSGNPHFKSLHAYLGVTVSVLMLAQYLFGFLIWATPAVFGGVDEAKALWKYHRWIGYVVFPLLLATALSATGTEYNIGVLGIKLWAMAIAAALIVIGVYPRVHIKKLGLRPWSSRRQGQE